MKFIFGTVNKKILGYVDLQSLLKRRLRGNSAVGCINPSYGKRGTGPGGTRGKLGTGGERTLEITH